MSTAVDMLTRLFSLIDLIDYDSLIIIPQQHVVNIMERILHNVRSAVIILGEEERGTEHGAGNIYFFSTRGIPRDAFWIDLIKGNVHHDTLVKIKSLITRDLKEVNIVARESSQDTLLAYEALSELRRINSEAKVKVLLDIEKLDCALNDATFMALALDKGLIDVTTIANLSRIATKIHALNDAERVQELRWCLANLIRAADKALENDVHITTTICYSTSVPDIFKDLHGFIRFSRFASWGMEYRSRGMYGTIEGPPHIVNENQLKELARREDWLYSNVELRKGPKLRVAALDINAQILREFLRLALTQISSQEGDTITGYVELYKVAGYIESLIKGLRW